MPRASSRAPGTPPAVEAAHRPPVTRLGVVDQAEHHGKRIVILRHGKPAAAIAPVDVAAPKRRPAKGLGDDDVRRSVQAFVEEFSAAEAHVSAA